MKNSFLQQFPDSPSSPWTIFCAGHLARLTLRGPSGTLEIWCAYYPTGGGRAVEREARQALTATIAQHCLPPSRALTVLAGDWNFVCSADERLCITQNSWTGDRDSHEADHFRDTLLQPFQFKELQQDNFTYFHPVTASKIDRIYTDHHPATQLDHNYHCNTLQHPKGLSKHCPVSFGRASSMKQRSEDDSITVSIPQPIKT